jgi:hypothetical protein
MAFCVNLFSQDELSALTTIGSHTKGENSGKSQKQIYMDEGACQRLLKILSTARKDDSDAAPIIKEISRGRSTPTTQKPI